MNATTDMRALHAALDELDARQARSSFLGFYRRMTGFKDPKHVTVLCKVLQAMEDDTIDRAMVFLPPRHAKTTCCSILFPAWLMGRNPSSLMMSVAHTDRYAAKLGGRVRNLMRSPKWPWREVYLAGDTQAKQAFATPQGGEYNGFGMFGGNQHGNPAEWLFMDDIIKGRKVAMSAHMRGEAWETYTTDLLSRLQGRRKQLMVFTRWNMDDPAGRMLPEKFDGRSGWYRDRETGEPWYVLSLPAVAEHDNDPCGRQKGEWLWPEAFGEKQLGGMRRRGGWQWSALFQQRPSPEEGMLFTSEHLQQRFRHGGLNLSTMQVYISSDYATTDQGEKPDPDWTVHLVWAVDPDWNIYLIDGWRGRTLSDRWVAEWIRLVKQYRPLRAFEEGGQIIKSVGPLITRTMQQERAFTSRVQLTSSTDKVARAHSLLGYAAMGKMFLPDRATCPKHMLDLLDAFETEMMQFPAGRHDDTVDAATLFGRGLDRIARGTEQKRRSPQGDTLDDLWSRYEQDQDQDGWP